MKFASKPLSEYHILSSVPDGAEAYLIATLFTQRSQDILHVARDDTRMVHVAENIALFAPEVEVFRFPAWDCLPYDRVSPNSNLVSQRLHTLSSLVHRSDAKPCIIVTTVNALLQRVLPRDVIEKASYMLNVGDQVDRDALAHFLIQNGYVNVGTANEPGEFALRGGIVDIVMAEEETGFRLDLFGTTLESIRIFDPLTQISGGKIDSIHILPASEVLLNEHSIALFRDQYREQFGGIASEDPLYEAVSEGRKYAGMEHWLPLYYEKLESLMNYVSEVTITFDHLSDEAHEERFKTIEDHYLARCKVLEESKLSDTVYHPITPEQLYIRREEWDNITGQYPTIRLYPYAMPEKEGEVLDTGYKQGNIFASESKQQQISVFELLKDYIQSYRSLNAKGQTSQATRFIIACMSVGSRERLQSMMQEHGLHVVMIEAWGEIQKISGKSIGLVVLDLDRGFIADGLVIISEQDLLGERMRSRKTKKRPEQFLNEASSLTEGELVVHKEHGIGRFEGLETLTVSGNAHDCVKLIYHGDDKLFIPVENIDVLSRYGGASELAKLDKLGGVAWQARKAKLKKRIQIAAEELLKVAAERSLRKGDVMVPLKGMYEEFCARFPYAETDDQLRCIEEVEEDLAQGISMDRLVCGDVGFGKTEVALRAAFIAVSCEGKRQVAVVVPTTLLARQHFHNFKERFAGLPVNIRQLSRMVSSKEAKETREALKKGEVDIVVGTHALLAKTIEFSNLGLLIIDEEQHFGVAQKERLKQLRSDVHVLTLTATPIPRTLQMSLSGLRELSLITTPPVDRLAVRTFVMPYDGVVIREAILREHYRGGKTFYVCPRIKDLDQMHEKLKKLVPEVKIVVAHGQMAPGALDDIMNDFYEGRYDILLSTTIVESGIDIPTANTMVIHRADMFSLSALYQLRGRVGRSKLRAYAYLTLPPNRTPTKNALKRLEVMQTLDTLGAGFTLASHDMDIRGAGNILGDEQSGHIKEVGVELYQQMLEETIAAIKSENKDSEQVETESWSPQINVGLPVMIPETYVEDLPLRLGLYKRAASLTSSEEVEAFAAELVDRFGAIPLETENLFHTVKLKCLCREAGIEKIDAGPKAIVIGFRNNQFKHPEKLLEMIAKQPTRMKIRGDQKLVVSQEIHNDQEKVQAITNAIQTISGL